MGKQLLSGLIMLNHDKLMAQLSAYRLPKDLVECEIKKLPLAIIYYLNKKYFIG